MSFSARNLSRPAVDYQLTQLLERVSKIPMQFRSPDLAGAKACDFVELIGTTKVVP
jgi:hypothetical protein